MTEKKIFIANDGTVFQTKENCIKYEQDQRNRLVTEINIYKDRILPLRFIEYQRAKKDFMIALKRKRYKEISIRAREVDIIGRLYQEGQEEYRQKRTELKNL